MLLLVKSEIAGKKRKWCFHSFISRTGLDVPRFDEDNLCPSVLPGHLLTNISVVFYILLIIIIATLIIKQCSDFQEILGQYKSGTLSKIDYKENRRKLQHMKWWTFMKNSPLAVEGSPSKAFHRIASTFSNLHSIFDE